MITTSFYQYHYYLPSIDEHVACIPREENFLKGLVTVKALANEDDARLPQGRTPSSNIPTWLKLWYNAPGTFISRHPNTVVGQNLFHYLVHRNFTHCLREALNAAQEWFSSETKQRLDALGSGQEYGPFTAAGALVPSLRSLVDGQDFEGRTPLHLALAKENYEMVRLLLVYGASPWFKNPSTDLLPIQIADKLRGFEKEHQARLLSRRRMLGGADPGDLGVILHHLDDDESGNGGIGEVHNPNAPALRCFAMIEAYPQAYTKLQQEAQPFGLIATNYFMWESQQLIDAVQRRNYQEAILHSRHRCVKSCFFTTMALTLCDSCRPGSKLEGSVDSLRAQTMIVRWCLAALSADVWNDKAKDLLLQTLEGVAHPLTLLLASEIRVFFSAKAMGTVDMKIHKEEAIFRHQLAALKLLSQGASDADDDKKSSKSGVSSRTGSYSSALLSSFNTSESGESELLFPTAKKAAESLRQHAEGVGSIEMDSSREVKKPRVGKSVVDEVTGDVSVFVHLRAEKERLRDNTSKQSSGMWVILPHSSENVLNATHGVVRSEVALGFPYQTGELVTFESSEDTAASEERKFIRTIRGTSVSLPVRASVHSLVTGCSLQETVVTLKNYVRIWGVSCDDAIEILSDYEWPVTSVVQLLQPGLRSCWCSLLRGRYGEQLWVSKLCAEEEQICLDKISSENREHIGVGMIEWRPQYARKAEMEPGRLLLYDKRSLRFISMIHDETGVEK